MPRGDKSKYTDRQKRKAEHIEEGYEKRGVAEKEAERRAWATVNKEEGGGNQSGSGRGVPDTHVSSRKGGRLGGRAGNRCKGTSAGAGTASAARAVRQESAMPVCARIAAATFRARARVRSGTASGL